MILAFSTASFAYVQIFLFFILASAIYETAKGLSNYFKARNHPEKHITWCSTVYLVQGFLFVTMLQYFLALEESISANLEIEPIYVLSHVISVVCLTMLTHLIVPDFNAPDVQEAMKTPNPGYEMKFFYRRHRKTLAVVSFIYLLCAAANYGQLNGSYENYPSERLPLHIIFAVLCATFFFTDDKYEKVFSAIHRVSAFIALVIITVMVIFTL